MLSLTKELTDWTIRPMRISEFPLLWDFLYDAIFLPPGVEPPPRSILRRPELRVYIDGFGKDEHDYCLVADVKGEVVGAVWVRIMNDYGHLDDDTPSFAISVVREWRGMGIGTDLMKEMLAYLKRNGYRQASLSVQKTNFAADLYRKLGFETVSETEEEYLMVIALNG